MDPEERRRRQAEMARRNFTKYEPWIDPDGQRRALSTHPYYDICRRLISRGLAEQPDPDFRFYPEICDRWLDLRTFVLELEDTAGPRPNLRAWLVPLVPAFSLGPDNAYWYVRPLTRKQRYFVMRGGVLR